MRPRFIQAALAGMVTIGVVGGLLYGVIFASFFASNRGSAIGVMKAPRSSVGSRWLTYRSAYSLRSWCYGAASSRPVGAHSQGRFLGC